MSSERVADIRDDRQVHAHVLVDRGPVDIDVNFARVRAERIQPPGHPVVEAGAEAHHEVGLVHRHIGFVGAVHPQHPEPLRPGCRIGAEPHQRGGHRRAADPREFAQQLACRGAGVDDPAAGIQHRPLGGGEHVHRRFDARLVGLDLRAIGLVADRAGLGVARGGDLHVLRDVDHDRTGATRGRDVERLVDRRAELGGILDQVIVLRTMPRDADGVRFLERVGPDQRGRHLAGDHDHRDRIHQRIGNAGNRVGRAGARGDEHHAGLAGRARVTLGGMRGGLLMANEDVLDPPRPEQRVVDWQHRATGVAEHDFHAEIAQRLDQDVGSTLLGHGRSP